MPKPLVATDLSPRARLALSRGLELAQASGAVLPVLHVVDDDLPPRLLAEELRLRRDALRAEIEAVEAGAGQRVRLLVETGPVFETIDRIATAEGVEVVVMGAHRRQVLRDAFLGTTLDRVLRLGRHAVLVAAGPGGRPWRKVLVATDLDPVSAHALRRAQALGLLAGGEVVVLHAFRALARDQLAYVGADPEAIRHHAARAARDARAELQAFLGREVPGLGPARIEVREGPPVEAILVQAEEFDADLVVIGTRARTGLGRLLLGSVADALLRRLQRDLVLVPPPAEG